MRKERKHYTGDEKVAILRRHLLDKVPVSDLCEEHGLRVVSVDIEVSLDSGEGGCELVLLQDSSVTKMHTALLRAHVRE